jgi:glycosyltransferase involved in cell wall biosynthesis
MKDKIVFLFVGRILRDKGYFELISAAKLIKNEYDNVEFHVIGPFDNQPASISDEIVYQNHKDKIIKYLGHKTNIIEYIRYCDCILLPSYHEGMSRILMEAASMSKPIIASNIYGCKEIVLDGINGFLVKPKCHKDLYLKIIKFLKLSNKEKNMMGKQSRVLALEKFDVRNVIAKYHNLLESLIID